LIIESPAAAAERWWEAEIHRLKGVFLLSAKSFAESETSFEQSIRVARLQQAKSLELRAATSLARLWCARDRVLPFTRARKG